MSPGIAVGAVLISWSMLKSRWSPAESHVDLISRSRAKKLQLAIFFFKSQLSRLKQSPK